MARNLTEVVAESVRRALPNHGEGCGLIVLESLREKEKVAGFGKLTADRILPRDMAVAAFGDAWEFKLKAVADRGGDWQAESTGAVDSSVFREIANGQMTLAAREGAEPVRAIAEQLYTPEQTTFEEGAVELPEPLTFYATGASKDLAEAEPYPRTSFASLNTYMPVPDKHGLSAYLTLEAFRLNRNSRYLKAQREVARTVELAWLYKVLRLVTGIDNTFKRGTSAGQTSLNTFQTAGTYWTNAIDDFVPTEPADIDAALSLFDSMVDPLRGLPMDINPTQWLVPTANAYNLRSILGVTEIRTTTGSVETVTGNPVDGPNEVLVEKYLYQVLVAAGITPAIARTYALVGDFKEAFGARIEEETRTFEAGPSDNDWGPPMDQDVVYATKTRFRKKPYVRSPYHVLRLRNTAAT